MDDLPSGILEGILLKLPAKSILRFRAVSKSWLEIIDDPSFRRSFEAKECMILGLSRDSKNRVPTIYSIVADGRSVQAKEIVRAEGLQDFVLMNCCRGLFYFVEYECGQPQGLVFNPLTREALKLPERPRWSCYHRIHQAMGFDHLTGTFKIVELFFEDSETRNLSVATFNLKTGCWAKRKGPRCPSNPGIYDHVHATNTGTVYWHIGSNIMYDSLIDTPKQWPEGSCGQLIFSFNVGKEEFRSNWFPKRVYPSYPMHITELNGRLTVCSYGVNYINLYELVDYQSQTWVRRCRIPKPPTQISVDLSYFAEKNILIVYPLSKNDIKTKQFYLYDFENGERTSLGEGRFNLYIDVYCVKPYLVSMKGSEQMQV